MNLATILLSLLLAAQGSKAPTMRYFQGQFVLREGKQITRIPLQLVKPKPPQSLAFRRNKVFVVWDDRGLSVRVGKKLTTYALTGYSVSPRIFSREDILKTLDLVKKGKRRRGADALSGAIRISGVCYVLARWDTPEGTPWMETLISVDLRDPAPKPKLIAKLPAHSTATGQIDDKLFILDDKLSTIAVKGDEWGIAQFETASAQFVFVPLGKGLQSFTPIDPRLGLYVEKSSYGTHIAGRTP